MNRAGNGFVQTGAPKPSNCPNCPLDIGDEGRIGWMVAWLKQLAADERAVADHDGIRRA